MQVSGSLCPALYQTVFPSLAGHLREGLARETRFPPPRDIFSHRTDVGRQSDLKTIVPKTVRTIGSQTS